MAFFVLLNISNVMTSSRIPIRNLKLLNLALCLKKKNVHARDGAFQTPSPIFRMFFNITFVYTLRTIPSNKQFPPLNLKNLVYLHHP